MNIEYADVAQFVDLVLYLLLIVYTSSIFCCISKSMMKVNKKHNENQTSRYVVMIIINITLDRMCKICMNTLWNIINPIKHYMDLNNVMNVCITPPPPPFFVHVWDSSQVMTWEGFVSWCVPTIGLRGFIAWYILSHMIILSLSPCL